ncbi:hypothetical protein [Streptomyces albipurpureus]|uniref:Uncharacterized protein n=1 Tax=Streptomyces albipurpureus TaxID=2897419 RepID=A0ABT0UHC5_9ACTN|nr:hypothetical protein [Streptomyces sp. CWNU-1]MCM2387444.1 hypothetical protein [Streptomyces sp. CWNU-1]
MTSCALARRLFGTLGGFTTFFTYYLKSERLAPLFALVPNVGASPDDPRD